MLKLFPSHPILSDDTVSGFSFFQNLFLIAQINLKFMRHTVPEPRLAPTHDPLAQPLWTHLSELKWFAGLPWVHLDKQALNFTPQSSALCLCLTRGKFIQDWEACMKQWYCSQLPFRSDTLSTPGLHCPLLSTWLLCSVIGSGVTWNLAESQYLQEQLHPGTNPSAVELQFWHLRQTSC